MSSHNVRRFPLRFLARLGALAGTAVAVSVCGSQDRLSPGGPTGPGTDVTFPVVQVILPTDTLIEIADSLKFTVTVTDNAKLKSAQVSVTGLGGFALTVTKDTTFAVGTTIPTYTQAFVVPLPTNAAGQRIAINATATDGSDNVTTVTDTVRVNDAQPPVVTMLSPAAAVAVGSGDTIHVLARATDPSGVRYLGARLFVRDSVLGRIQTLAVDSLAYVSRVTTRLDSFKIVVPTSLAPGNYILQAFSADSSPFFNKGASPDIAVAVRDVRPPTGSFNGPTLDSQVVAGDTLPISFHASDNVGVDSVTFRGFSVRRNPLGGPPDTTLRFQSGTARFPRHPADTTPVVRRLVPVLSAATADSVILEAKITDIGGNVTTVTRRIQVITGVRAVTILSPLLVDTAVSAGDSVLVQFRVQDRRGITKVIVDGLALRGDSSLGTDTLVPRFTQRFDILNSVQDTTLRRYLWADTTDRRAEPVFVFVRMVSTAGDTITALRRIQIISGPSARVAAPAQDTTVAVGNPLALTISGFDPDSVKAVGYASTGAIARRDSSVYVSPLGQTRTAALSLPVPGTTPLTKDTLTPFVIDRLGNRTVGQPVVVTFKDLTPPTLTFVGPSIDSGIAYGDSVRVRVRVRDNAPGTAVSLVGRAVNAAGQTQTWFAAASVAGVASVDTTVARYLPALAVDPAGSLVYLVGTATDAVGNTFQDSIRVQVTSGPYVRITAPLSGDSIRLDQTGARILPLVQAYSPDTILYLGYIATGRIVGTDSIATSRALTATTLAQQLALVVPYSTPLGTVVLTPFARTKSGRFTGPAVNVELKDGSLPVVQIIAPTRAGTFQVAAGDSLFVRVAASDDRQLKSLTLAGYSRRPDLWPDSLGQVTVVQRYLAKTIDLTGTVHDTVVRYLNAVLTDSTAENAYIVATATDSAGNVAVDTVRVQVLVGGPTMTLVRPTAGAITSPGRTIVIEVAAASSHGVRLAGWRATGVLAVEDSAFYSAVGGRLPQSVDSAYTITIPAATPVGSFTIVPFGVDSLGNVSTTMSGITVQVMTGVTDSIRPTVSFSIGRRIEVTDSIIINVRDAGGIYRVGWTAKVLGPDTVVGTDTTASQCSPNCLVSDATVRDPLNLPTTLRFPAQVVIQAFAWDSTGNRGVSAAETLTTVAGKTYALPAGSQIADAIYNQRLRKLYLSNFAHDRIEVFSLATNSFEAPIPVGSRPWGLALWPRATSANAADTLYADTLIVANSGGTNLSIVDLALSTPREVRRHRLPNYSVEDVKSVSNTSGGVNLSVKAYDLADRPQYVAAVCRAGGTTACDSVIAIYSTTPTGGQTAPYQGRGYLAWENLSQTGNVSGKSHLFWEQADHQGANQDTIQILATQYTSGGGTFVDTIVGAAAAKIIDLDALLFRDTTYVRNSGNFLRALIGEGGGGLSLARVMAYDATVGLVTTGAGTTGLVGGVIAMSKIVQRDDGVSNGTLVQDFIGNRASSVTAVATNFNGLTNLVRADSIYVFDNTLRQTGMLQVSGAAHGMDLAPLNAFNANLRGTTLPGQSDARIVFAARPDSSIDVFDTYFFGEVTDTSIATVPIPIRNALVGAVRVTPDLGGTVLTGVSNRGLVVVRLPALVNPFLAPSMTSGLTSTAPRVGSPVVIRNATKAVAGRSRTPREE